jgi:hypothetical protein
LQRRVWTAALLVGCLVWVVVVGLAYLGPAGLRKDCRAVLNLVMIAVPLSTLFRRLAADARIKSRTGL